MIIARERSSQTPPAPWQALVKPSEYPFSLLWLYFAVTYATRGFVAHFGPAEICLVRASLCTAGTKGYFTNLGLCRWPSATGSDPTDHVL
jgi:hypothetical protein